jgi:outer membrane immunogenic protein
MKGLLAIGALIAASSSAVAADLPLPPLVAPPPYALPIAYSWSGCYVGGEGGPAWGKSSQTAAISPIPGEVGLPITNNFGTTGGLFGVTLGCNYQVANFAFGAEGDASFSFITGKVGDQPPFGPHATSSTNETSFSTLRGRAGFAWDRLFFYGTGGAAFANVGVNVCANEIGVCVSDQQIRTGWVAGGGIEWATWGLPDGSVTLKLEYLHADLGTGLLINPPVTINRDTFVSRDVRLTNDIIRVGLNWKFIGW